MPLPGCAAIFGSFFEAEVGKKNLEKRGEIWSERERGKLVRGACSLLYRLEHRSPSQEANASAFAGNLDR